MTMAMPAITAGCLQGATAGIGFGVGAATAGTRVGAADGRTTGVAGLGAGGSPGGGGGAADFAFSLTEFFGCPVLTGWAAIVRGGTTGGVASDFGGAGFGGSGRIVGARDGTSGGAAATGGAGAFGATGGADGLSGGAAAAGGAGASGTAGATGALDIDGETGELCSTSLVWAEVSTLPRSAGGGPSQAYSLDSPGGGPESGLVDEVPLAGVLAAVISSATRCTRGSKFARVSDATDWSSAWVASSSCPRFTKSRIDSSSCSCFLFFSRAKIST